MNRIKELREKKGLSQIQLAKKTGISSQSISKYECGERNPKIEKWQKLATFFNVSIPYLQGIDERIYNLKFPTKAEAIAFIGSV